MDQLITTGSDPEIMLRNRKTERIESAIEILNKSKYDPIILGPGREFYYDNVLAEFSVVPANSRDGMIQSLGESLRGIAEYIGVAYDIVPRASHVFEPEQCQHEDACVFGCNPEYDAWRLQMCKPPECTNTFRSAGGHIHVGRSDFQEYLGNRKGIFLMEDASKANTIKSMDIYVGLPIAIMDQDPTSPARKAIYGRAGRHRPTPYGVEYRTPSNYWIGSPDLVGVIHDLTMHAVTTMQKGPIDSIIDELGVENIIKAVDENDKDLAANLIHKSGLPDHLIKAVFDRANRQYKSLYEEWQIGK